MKKQRVFHVVISVILALNIIATGYLFYTVYNTSKDVRYSMYIGLNDKDTYSQLIPYDEALTIIETTCEKYVDGFTVQNAKGMWRDETGTSTHENTVVCYFYKTDDTTIYRIADELKSQLNQNSILIEKSTVTTELH